MARFKKGIVALMLGATIAGAAVTPAEARGYYRGGHGYGGYHHYYRGGVSSGAAVGIGLLGLGLGAAIASQPRYYNGGYAYGGPVYYDDYYAPPPPPRYYRECYARHVWDPYIRRTVRIESCN